MTTAVVKDRVEVESEIRETLGIVPSFFSRIPDELLGLEWELMRHFELDETRIPRKYKHLMGLAIHSETKCRYCSLFHTEMARLFGATEEELQEAVHYAKESVGWSVYLNGTRTDLDEFESELHEMTAFARAQQVSDE